MRDDVYKRRRSYVATLHLIVGLPCSGKTTLARQLETRYSALRLTTDEWHIRLFGQDYGENMTQAEEATHNFRHASVESIMWDVAARVLVLGVDVILDFGCWVRTQRDEFRSLAKELGADFRIHYADASDEALFERLKARNQMRTEGTFFIPEGKLKEWIQIFEPPSSEELESLRV
jgi:predicted kinase